MAPTLDVVTLSSLAAAFGAALTGSLHCVGMCGPLRLIAGNQARNRLAYQGGRGLAYALLGGFAGSLGWAMPIWALAILVAGGIAFTFLGAKAPVSWQKRRASLLALASTSPFLFGLSSGLLPCGMLHAWIAAAAATASPLIGSALLLLLWLGTLPALELSGYTLAKPLGTLRKKYPRLLPAAFLLLAFLPFLLRAQAPQPEGQSSVAPLQCHY